MPLSSLGWATAPPSLVGVTMGICPAAPRPLALALCPGGQGSGCLACAVWTSPLQECGCLSPLEVVSDQAVQQVGLEDNDGILCMCAGLL